MRKNEHMEIEEEHKTDLGSFYLLNWNQDAQKGRKKKNNYIMREGKPNEDIYFDLKTTLVS